MIWRLKLFHYLLICLFLLVIARLFYWQVIKGKELALQGLSQYAKINQIEPLRGEIKASDNSILATNIPSFLVYAEPGKIEDKNKTTRLLSTQLSIPEASISAVLSQELDWVPIKNKVDVKTKEAIGKLEIKGLGFEKHHTRFYPESSMAAHLLGFVGRDDTGLDKGYFGVEGYHDRELKGRPGRTREIKDIQGHPILLGERIGEEKVDGQSLILHLNRRIQFIAETRLKEGIKKYGASGGTVVIMDPKTGGILASASYPDYDPTKYEKYDEATFRDPFVFDVYEPGSTFKILTMASALNEAVVTSETQCDQTCNGSQTIGDYTIRTWNNKYFPKSTMREVIEHSDNTGMLFVVRKLGLDKLIGYLDKFGIGSLTGIDLQGETNPQMRGRDKWYPIDLATASFGQGVAVTPVQMLTAVAAIANQGLLMEPHVVSKIVDSTGKEIVIKPKVVREVISRDTAKDITDMMVNAIERGEAKWTKLKGYTIAGKTGTSQIPIAGHYDPDRTVASFVGFAPVNPEPAVGPKFVMLVKINEPKSSSYGSETAAPIFFKIAKEILEYYNIPPKE